jgi:hypothetical protein
MNKKNILIIIVIIVVVSLVGSIGGYMYLKNKNKFIKVTFPNNSEIWKIGETYDITWSAKNIKKVNIYLDGSCTETLCTMIACAPPPPPAGPKCWVDCRGSLIAKNIDASLEKYSWTIPKDQALFIDARIHVQEVVSDIKTQTCLSDLSDNSFSIVK